MHVTMGGTLLTLASFPGWVDVLRGCGADAKRTSGPEPEGEESRRVDSPRAALFDSALRQ